MGKQGAPRCKLPGSKTTVAAQVQIRLGLWQDCIRHGRGLHLGLITWGWRVSRTRWAEKLMAKASSSWWITNFVISKVTTASSAGRSPQLVDVLLRMLLCSSRGSGLAKEGGVFMETKFLQNTRAARTRSASTFLHASFRWCLSAASSCNRLRGPCG